MLRTFLLAVTVIFCLPLCAWAQTKDYSYFAIPEELKNNASAVIRHHHVKYELFSQDQMTETVTRVVTVLNEDGLDHLRTYVFHDGSTKVASLQAVVYDKSGKELEKFRKKDFRDVSVSDGFSLFDDNRIYFLKYTPVSYPFTLEFIYEIKTPNTAFLLGHSFREDYHVSTEYSSYEVKYDQSLGSPRKLERNLDSETIKMVSEPGRVYYEASGLPAIKREDLSPVMKEFSPYARVAFDRFHIEGKDGYAPTWEALGKWIANSLVEGRQEISPETLAEVRELTDGVEDIYQKSKLIYEYVQEKTRYISVQVGIGGWQPIAAIDVDRVKYGDCKGLTNYTMALLRAVGVPSYYVVVHAGKQQQDLEAEFPALIGPNHVILAIPYKDGYLWNDCTSKIHPFGFIGDFTDNRNVLLVSPEGGELLKTEAYLDEENHLITEAQCVIDESGSLQAKVVRTARGIEYNNEFLKWEQTNDEEDLKEYFAKKWAYLNGVEIQSMIHADKKEEVMLKEELDLTVNNYLARAGDQLLLNLNPFNRISELPGRYRNRKLPFGISRGFLHTDTYHIQVPEGYRPDTLPLPVNIETVYGSYSVSFRLNEDNSITYKREFLLKHGDYTPDEYEDFRDFLKRARKSDHIKVVLEPVNAIAKK